MTLDELETLSGESKRGIRYLIGEGFVPRPAGTRASPVYDTRHVEAIRRIQALKARGLKPAQIKMLPEYREDGPRHLMMIEIRPGLLIEIDFDKLGDLPPTRQLGAEIARAINQAVAETSACSPQETPDAKKSA